ncbi:MAG: glycosyltransferase [Erysipelotrichaceae bacterium]|nr:glycosyltransferase [Erysipelotrichaceae bacterium]
MKKKILFVNDEMTMGGVARILNTFLKMIDKEKYEVDLLVLHKRGELLAEIPDGINVIGGSDFFNAIDIPLKQCKGNILLSKLRLLFYMKTGLIKNKIAKERKKILNKHYDIEFSAKEGFCTIFTGYGDSDKKVNWVQVDYKESNYSSNHMGLVKDALSHIDMNIACSEKVMESYKELFGVKRICVIHNLVDEERIRNLSLQAKTIETEDKKINLITVARFHRQKAVDRLINIQAKLKDYYSLIIIGDGELREELYELAKSKGVYDDIKWLGIRSNPYPDVRECDLFVMSSLYEGYPTMTVESLISDTPVLTTRVAGVNEQINDTNGWIVENSEEALYEKLNELKNSKDLLRQMKNDLFNYHYDNESILNRYYEIFEN